MGKAFIEDYKDSVGHYSRARGEDAYGKSGHELVNAEALTGQNFLGDLSFDSVDPATGKLRKWAGEAWVFEGKLTPQVREAYIKPLTSFAREFPRAMQAMHAGLAYPGKNLASAKKYWKESVANLGTSAGGNVPESMLVYHEDFLDQYDATEADKSATIASRIWRVKGSGADDEAPYVRCGTDTTTGAMDGEVGRIKNKSGTFWCENREFGLIAGAVSGEMPILDGVKVALAVFAEQTAATRGRPGMLPMTFLPWYTPTSADALQRGQTGTTKLSRRWQPANQIDSIVLQLATSDPGPGSPGPWYGTLLNFAYVKYWEWLFWRKQALTDEDEQFDDWSQMDIRNMDPDEIEAHIARMAAASAASTEEAKVRVEIAKGLIQKAAFREQCFLLSKIFPLVDYKTTHLDAIVGKRLPYTNNEFYKAASVPDNPCLEFDQSLQGNACLQVDGSSFGFMNLLTTDPKLFPLFQAHHSQLSMLQPMMRFFKVSEKVVDGNETTTEQEITFDAFEKSFPQIMDAQAVFKASHSRGLGAGIKSFDFTYDGSNPFAVKKSIKAKLVIFANSFDELMRCRGNCKSADKTKGFRYIDLALKTGGPRLGDSAPAGYRRGSEEEGEDPLACIPVTTGLPTEQEAKNLTVDDDELSKLNFRLKAVVGYAAPPTLANEEFWSIENRGNKIGNVASAFRGTTTDEYNKIRAAIDSSFVTLNLTPTTHHFNFDEMGRVTFTINYLAYVEDFFDQQHFNIFTDLSIAKFMFFRRMRMDKLRKACKNEEINKIKEKEKNDISDNQIKSLKSLTQRLFKSGRVQILNISYEQLSEWRSEGPYTNIGDIAPIAGQSNLNIKEAQNATDRIVQDAVSQLAKAQSDGSQESREAELSSRLFSKYTNDYNSQSIPYFYVSDLVDTVLEGLEEYLGENGMQKIITEVRPGSTGGLPEEGLEFITECDKAYETYKLRKFQEQFQHFRAVLGPVEIINPRDIGQSRFVNFGDLPISIKYFNEWLTAKLLKKERPLYTLPRFLNDLFNHLVRNFLNDDTCFNYSIRQKIKVNQAVITDYTSAEAEGLREHAQWASIDTLTYHTWMTNQTRRRSQGDTSLYQPLRLVPLYNNNDASAESGTKQAYAQPGGYGGNGELTAPVLNISGPAADSRTVVDPTSDEAGIARESNYLIYYAGRTRPTELMTGNLFEDVKNGIMHYNHGQDVGIVKKVTLKKTESPGLAEVRFEQDGYDGLQQLRVLYDTTISTFCLPNAFPGQYLYVDPRSFSPHEGGAYGEKYDLTELGIGGYFMAHKVETRLAPGKAETQIHAKWVAEVNKDTEAGTADFADDGIPGSEDVDSRDPATVSQCKQARQRRKGEATRGLAAFDAAVEERDDVGDNGIPWVPFF
jgi:hypothetical protein